MASGVIQGYRYDRKTFTWGKLRDEGYTGILYIKLEHVILYMKNGQRHREDGPARIELSDGGDETYWLNDDRLYDKREFYVRVSKLGKVLYGR